MSHNNHCYKQTPGQFPDDIEKQNKLLESSQFQRSTIILASYTSESRPLLGNYYPWANHTIRKAMISALDAANTRLRPFASFYMPPNLNDFCSRERLKKERKQPVFFSKKNVRVGTCIFNNASLV